MTENFIGQRFGKLEVLGELPPIRDNNGSLRRWVKVKCECGQVVEKKLKYLKNGDTSSCGKCIYEVVDKSSKGCPVVSLEPFEDELSMLGNYYQHWKVTEAGFRSGVRRMLKAVCTCGSEQYVDKNALLSGHSNSCGCYTRKLNSELMTTHGMADSKEYRIWANMRARCNNPNIESYINYGGRGISHQDSWKYFDEFWKDMGPSYILGLELDRINVNGDYCLENCRWTDNSTQAYNQRQYKNNTSGKTGVVLNKRSQNWVVSINVMKEKIYIGTFSDLSLAVKAREDAEFKYYGELKGH